MAVSKWIAFVGVFVVLVSACTRSSPEVVADDAASDDAAQSRVLPTQIENHGGSMEGHTPRGFAGSGTGLGNDSRY